MQNTERYTYKLAKQDQRFSGGNRNFCCNLIKYDNKTGERTFGFTLCSFMNETHRDSYSGQLALMTGLKFCILNSDGTVPERLEQ